MNDTKGSKGRGDPNKKLFIGGVPKSVSDEEFREYFRSFGELDDCILMRDSSGVCRGFGFVTYKDEDSYIDVSQAELHLQGQKIEQRKAVPPGQVVEKNNEVKIFVGGLSQNVDKSALDDFFGQFGEIADSIVMMDDVSGKSRGFGFVTFSESSSVDEIMKNPRFEICGKEVQCKRALPKTASNRMSRERRGGWGHGYGKHGGNGSFNERVINRNSGYGERSYGQRDYQAVGIARGGYRRQEAGNRGSRNVDEGFLRRDMRFEGEDEYFRGRVKQDFHSSARYPGSGDVYGNRGYGEGSRYQPY